VVDAGNHCLVSSRLFISTLFYYISFNQQHSAMMIYSEMPTLCGDCIAQEQSPAHAGSTTVSAYDAMEAELRRKTDPARN
jgi:hypothetical protein